MDLKQKIEQLTKAYKLKFLAELIGVHISTMTYKSKDPGRFTYAEALKIESLYEEFQKSKVKP